jgi:DNA adenine methylase
VKLAEQLSKIKGKYLISLNDTPEIRDIFKGYIIESTSSVYSCGKARSQAKEVLIRNY